MDGRPTWTNCDEAGDDIVPNVLSPRDLDFRPDNMDETVPNWLLVSSWKISFRKDAFFNAVRMITFRWKYYIFYLFLLKKYLAVGYTLETPH